jgi:hypothetical protein
VIVTPPSLRFCPWSTLRPPHFAVRGSGELSRYAWFYLFVVAVEAEHEGMDVQWMGGKKL